MGRKWIKQRGKEWMDGIMVTDYIQTFRFLLGLSVEARNKAGTVFRIRKDSQQKSEHY
jgi:hypothetical protein